MGWDYLTCVHGIREGLDSHDCSACQEIANKCKYDTSKGQTYIFTSQKQIDEWMETRRLDVKDVKKINKFQQCKKCEFSSVNFWNYVECWVIEKRQNATSTKYTAIRERHAHELNKDGHCEHYKRKKIKILFWKF